MPTRLTRPFGGWRTLPYSTCPPCWPYEREAAEAAAWERCEVDILPERRGRVVWGVDLIGWRCTVRGGRLLAGHGAPEALAAFPALPDF